MKKFLVTGIVAGVALAGCGGGGGGSVATGTGASPLANRVAFQSNRGGAFRLFSVKLDGSDAQPFGPSVAAASVAAARKRDTSALPVGARDFAISPDASKIAFAVSGVIEDVGGLYVANVDGSNQRRLSTRSVRQPAWRADGKQIVFAAGASMLSQGLSVVNIDGTGERPITTPVQVDVASPCFSPDGAFIVFTQKMEIYRLRVGDAQAAPLGEYPDPTVLFPMAYTPIYSPDGSRIVFGAQTTAPGGGSNGQIWAMNADGTNPVQLTKMSIGCAEPHYVANGTKIGFVAYPAGEQNDEIYTMNLDGSNPTRITQNPAKDVLVQQ